MKNIKVFNKDKKNFTPAGLMVKYSVQNNLPYKNNGYGKTLIRIKDIWYEYDHYEIEEDEDREIVTLYLVPYKDNPLWEKM